jgi:hypothetical protein
MTCLPPACSPAAGTLLSSNLNGSYLDDVASSHLFRNKGGCTVSPCQKQQAARDCSRPSPVVTVQPRQHPVRPKAVYRLGEAENCQSAASSIAAQQAFKLTNMISKETWAIRCLYSEHHGPAVLDGCSRPEAISGTGKGGCDRPFGPRRRTTTGAAIGLDRFRPRSTCVRRPSRRPSKSVRRCFRCRRSAAQGGPW